jgi:hypothetical protein
VSSDEAVIGLESYKERFSQHINTRVNLGGNSGNNLTLAHYFPLENSVRPRNFTNTKANGVRKKCSLCKQQLSWKSVLQSQNRYSNTIKSNYYSFDFGILLQDTSSKKSVKALLYWYSADLI